MVSDGGARRRGALAPEQRWLLLLGLGLLGLGGGDPIGPAGWLAAAAVVVAGVVYAAYRGYESLRVRYQSLETLQGFTRVVGRDLEIDSVMSAVLREARELTKCERAELVMVEQEAGKGGLRVIDDELSGRQVLPLGAVDSTDLLWARLVSGDRAFVATQDSSDTRLTAHLDERGIRNALIAPLHGDGGIVGMLLVANRLTEHTTFDPEQLRIFETLANHASVSLENGRLVDELRQEAAVREHQALHDQLTGLPNRAFFLRALRRELVTEVPGVAAVMLMDLDHFKEVNDTLGHHEGDRVLTKIAGHLLERVRSGDVVARLGGDGFAGHVAEGCEPECGDRTGSGDP